MLMFFIFAWPNNDYWNSGKKGLKLVLENSLFPPLSIRITIQPPSPPHSHPHTCTPSHRKQSASSELYWTVSTIFNILYWDSWNQWATSLAKDVVVTFRKYSWVLDTMWPDSFLPRLKVLLHCGCHGTWFTLYPSCPTPGCLASSVGGRIDGCEPCNPTET